MYVLYIDGRIASLIHEEDRIQTWRVSNLKFAQANDIQYDISTTYRNESGLLFTLHYRGSAVALWQDQNLYKRDEQIEMMVYDETKALQFKPTSSAVPRDEQSKEVFTRNENNIECVTCHKSLSTFGLIGDVITCDSCGTLNSIHTKDEPKEAKAEANGKWIHIDPYGMWRSIMP